MLGYPKMLKLRPDPQLKATASLMQFYKVIGFSFLEKVCCSKLIGKTKLIF